MKKPEAQVDNGAGQQISQHIAALADWRGTMTARLRKLIGQAGPELVEEWKWGTPVWAHKGNVVAAGAFKDHLKLNFFQGAALPDPSGLFNAGLDAKATRAIDLYEGDKLNEVALKALVQSAVAHNAAGKKK